MSAIYTQMFTARPDDIDIMGHVNNAVWVQWMEALATSHWQACAPAVMQAHYAWLVTRHEIDYRGNIREGESVTGETYLLHPAQGVKCDRCITFRDGTGKVLVSAKTTWAMLNRETLRLMRVPDAVMALFREG